VTTDGARHGGHEHVVDRGAERAPGAPDAPEVDRLGPANAVGDVLLGLDRRGRIRARHEQLGERLRIVDRRRGELGGVARVRQRLDALVRDGSRRARHRLDEAHQPAARAALCRRDPRVRLSAVGQREQHARERDAVGDAVVDPHQHRAARPVVVDQVDLPRRPAPVERHRNAIADELLQRAPVVRSGQRHVVEVQLGVELVVVLPARGRERRALDRALAEAVKARHDPLAEHGPAPPPVDRLVEPQDAVDDHQVRRPVHVQPRRVGGRHRVLTSH
jgi:hypothetical protein